MMKNLADLIRNKERAIVHFVRLALILLLMVSFTGCSNILAIGSPKYSNKQEEIEEAKLNINAGLDYITTDKEIKLIDSYIGNQNGITYYFAFFRVKATINGIEKTMFVTAIFNIKNDLTIQYADYEIVLGSD